jgi:ElaB/YqjD/DUF883 family membrane-anchored ribosome-binding protein
MNTEEFTQSEPETEKLQFDEHEFDGLRGEFAGLAQTWLKRGETFVHENPWLCIAIAAGAGFALAYALRSGASQDEEEEVA